METSKVTSQLFSSMEDNSSLLLQEAASIGIWEFRVDINKAYWSLETKKLHGVPYDYEPSVEDGICFYKEGYYRDKITSDFGGAMSEGKEFDEEYIIITKTGEEKWVRSVGVPVFENGKCVKIYGVFQDIDDQKKSQIRLEQKEQKFRQTFANAPNGVALVSLSGEWIQVNAQMCKIFGYSKEELDKLTLSELTHVEDLEKDKVLKEELLFGEKESYQKERRYKHKTGKIIWTVLSVSLVRGELESPNYFIYQITDITSRKAANQKIEVLLEKTKGQNEKLINFKHIVSHNLRSHTSNLDMLLRFLEQDIPDLKDVEVFTLLKSAFENLEETINNLSEISSFDNVSEKDYETINVKSTLEKTISSLSALLGGIEASIEIDIPNDLNIVGVSEYMRSVFLNMLTNAIKYRKEDTLLLVRIFYTQVEGYTVIHFQDNGLGIDLNLHKDKIFGLYKTFHRKPDSRGLGLYIVKNQIEAMEGKVSVDSEIGVGTTFNIHIKKNEQS